MLGKLATTYRPRRPRESPLYTLVEECYDETKGSWEERFERHYGFWRGTIEDAVFAFLDCGIYDNGFARVDCPECRAEYLVAFSCQRRGFCPSCAAKRGALFGALCARPSGVCEVPCRASPRPVPGAISWASRRDGVPPNLGASFPTVSNDAVVAFQSSSTNLTGFPDFNGTDDVFAVRMPLFAHGFESRDTGVW